MMGWIADGKLALEESIFDGVDKVPDAFIGLFSGGYTRKMLVRL